uniref:Phosphatidic acid phosphatase type 2/haloperoxidase domain-containing protein n=1 Tax=Acrobeloides nanus TaxID=290746 RepID=A0A914CBA1_9BILA
MVELSISKIVCDFAVLVVCAIPLLIFHEFVTPYKRGFYCDDESIRYPYRGSTVSRQMLIVVGILIPCALIIATEVFRAVLWEKKCVHQFKAYRCRQYNVHRLIVRLYVFIGYFFLGICFNQLLCDIAKYTIGRQRPHFMEVCKPNIGYNNCANDHKYITDYVCTGENKYWIHESQLSFYSGHSAFSFFAAWYTTFYLQARLYKPLYSRLVVPVIQFALFFGAFYVAYTRISKPAYTSLYTADWSSLDYKHHWSDVLVGSIVGSATGIIVALYVAELFDKREIPVKEIDENVCQFGLMEKQIVEAEEGKIGVTDRPVTAIRQIRANDPRGPSMIGTGSATDRPGTSNNMSTTPLLYPSGETASH